MTIVIHWLNKESEEYPSLWVVTDSLLSNQIYKGKSVPLFECGAKLFPVRVVCLKPDSIGFFNDIYFLNTIGMSFAGSSLLALNLHAFLSYTLGNLISDGSVIPSIENIAIHAYAVFQSLLNNYIEKNDCSLPCEISIFGFDHSSREYKLYHIFHAGKDKSVLFNEIKLKDHEDLHIMGDHKEEVRQLIVDYGQTRQSIITRVPKRVLEDIIDKKSYETIGGRIQLGICSFSGFQLKAICRPLVVGRPESTFFYQNIDIYSHDQLRCVGNLFVGVTGMV